MTKGSPTCPLLLSHAMGDQGQPHCALCSPLCPSPRHLHAPVMLLVQTSPWLSGAGSFERGSGPTPKGLKEQWHFHSVPKDLWPLGRDTPEPGMLPPQALASGWGLLSLPLLQRPFPSPGHLLTVLRCGVLVELQAGRSDHPSFPAGLFCSIGKFADAWEEAELGAR